MFSLSLSLNKQKYANAARCAMPIENYYINVCICGASRKFFFHFVPTKQQFSALRRDELDQLWHRHQRCRHGWLEINEWNVILSFYAHLEWLLVEALWWTAAKN